MVHTGGLRAEALDDHHDRRAFESGVEALDRYFRSLAGQDTRRRVATCFVLIEGETDRPVGYYTLAATGIALTDLPGAVARKLPRYPVIPATLMGRLAMDREHRGRGLGELLMLDAFSRALRSEITSYAFVVDAKDKGAAAFYAHYGFITLTEESRRLFLPMAEIAKIFA